MAKSAIAFFASIGALSWCAVGCQAPSDLSPQVVAALASEPGDATGSRWSGVYDFTRGEGGCWCDDGSQVCLFGSRRVQVVQYDGVVLFHFPGMQTPDGATLDQQLAGSIDRDGTFSVGLAQTIAWYLVQLDAVTRIDGYFFEDNGSVGFHAEMRGRHVIEQVSEQRACHEERHVEGRRIAAAVSVPGPGTPSSNGQ